MPHQEVPITRFQRLRWPMIVTGLLSAHVGAMVLAVNIASLGEGNAILPNYYQKAVEWDSLRERSAASEALGWELAMNVGTLANRDGTRTLRAVLTDPSGAPIIGASAALRIWHHEHRKQMDSPAVLTGTAGELEVNFPIDRSGAWHLEAIVTRGEEIFVHEEELQVMPVPSLDPVK